MKVQSTCSGFLVFGCMLLMPFSGLVAQSPSQVPSSITSKGLFETKGMLAITPTGKVRDCLNSRSGKPKNFPLNLSYHKDDSSEIVVPLL